MAGFAIHGPVDLQSIHQGEPQVDGPDQHALSLHLEFHGLVVLKLCFTGMAAGKCTPKQFPLRRLAEAASGLGGKGRGRHKKPASQGSGAPERRRKSAEATVGQQPAAATGCPPSRHRGQAAINDPAATIFSQPLHHSYPSR